MAKKSSSGADAEGAAPADSARDRFREALERKKAGRQGGDAQTSERRSTGPATQNAKATRMYRRKSG
jgi:hypothetical protein